MISDMTAHTSKLSEQLQLLIWSPMLSKTYNTLRGKMTLEDLHSLSKTLPTTTRSDWNPGLSSRVRITQSALQNACAVYVLFSSWWRHQMETFSALLAICAGNSPVPDEFPTQRPVTRGFDVFFDLRPGERLSKQSWGWWFKTPSHSLWRHRNVLQNIVPSWKWVISSRSGVVCCLT